MIATRIALLASLALSVFAALDKTNLVQQIDANTFQIGEVRLDKKERRLILPATVNMVEGQIEYILVSSIGKLHESIFKTTAEPIHVHTAAMLLAPKPASTNTPLEISISVELPDGKNVPIEVVFENANPEKSLKPGVWRYQGSRLVEGTFIAQRDGSITAIISDPDSIAESGRVSAEDDENWRPKKSVLPPLGTAVKIFLNFSPRK